MVIERKGNLIVVSDEGWGLITTDLHGDIAAFELVRDIFLRGKKYRWWIDLGDRCDVERMRFGDRTVRKDGDLAIVRSVDALDRKLRDEFKNGKTFIPLLGNHELRVSMLYGMLKENDLLKERKKSSLSTLLYIVAKRQDWVNMKREKLSSLREKYPELLERIELSDPGLSGARAELKFLVESVYCQHGFVMRMRDSDNRKIRNLPAAVWLPLSKIFMTHGGIADSDGDLEVIARGGWRTVHSLCWNRYSHDYGKKELLRFLGRCGGNMVITGHTPLDDIEVKDRRNSGYYRGFLISSKKLATFSSGYGQGRGKRVALRINSSREYKGPRQLETIPLQ